MSQVNVFGRMDATNLNLLASEKEIEDLYKYAFNYQVRAVCVPPTFVSRLSSINSSGPKICTVVSFPFGWDSVKSVHNIMLDMVMCGANELDLVMNYRAFRDQFRDYWRVLEAINKEMHDRFGTVTKLIIETYNLDLSSSEEICQASKLSVMAGFDYVKTNTGFFGPARASEVELIKNFCGDAVKIKAAGGIKTLSDFNRMIEAGADIVGTSSYKEIGDEYIVQIARDSRKTKEF